MKSNEAQNAKIYFTQNTDVKLMLSTLMKYHVTTMTRKMKRGTKESFMVWHGRYIHPSVQNQLDIKRFATNQWPERRQQPKPPSSHRCSNFLVCTTWAESTCWGCNLKSSGQTIIIQGATTSSVSFAITGRAPRL